MELLQRSYEFCGETAILAALPRKASAAGTRILSVSSPFSTRRTWILADLSKDHTAGNTMPTRAKMIPYLRIETLKNHTLSGGTFLSSPYMRGTPPPFRLSCTYPKSTIRLDRILWVLQVSRDFCFIPENHREGLCRGLYLAQPSLKINLTKTSSCLPNKYRRTSEPSSDKSAKINFYVKIKDLIHYKRRLFEACFIISKYE